MAEPGFLVCSGFLDHRGSRSEFRWVVGEGRLVAIEVREDASGWWRESSREEDDLLVAALAADHQPQKWFRAERTPIWAEAKSARRRIELADPEALRSQRSPLP